MKLNDFLEQHENHMKKGQEMTAIALETASPKQIKDWFDFFSKDDRSPGSSRCQPNYHYWSDLGNYFSLLQNDERGGLRFIITTLRDGTGFAISKTEHGFSLRKGKIKKHEGQPVGLRSEEILDYDKNSNLLKKTVYAPDDSYSVQDFKNGQLTSTTFYDKNDNLIRKKEVREGSQHVSKLRDDKSAGM